MTPTARLVASALSLVVAMSCAKHPEPKSQADAAAGPQASGSDASSEGDRAVDSAPRRTSQTTDVTLEVVHAVDLPTGAVGFQLHVRNWLPNGEISFFVVGADGDIVPVVAVEDHATVSSEGTATFSVPYDLQGLHPGTWVGVVAGPSGVHKFQLEIPRPERE